jgi:hypothetical protein
LARLLVPGSSDRKSCNVLGALDAITHKLLLVDNDSHTNAEAGWDLLGQVAGSGFAMIDHLGLDTASCQRYAPVQLLARSLHVEQLISPGGCPNLNLAEWLWKFVKRDP